MKSEISKLAEKIGEKRICRVQIFHNGDISIGVGDKIKHGNAKLRDDYYGEWEIGTFHRNWVMLDQGAEVCSGSISVYDPTVTEKRIADKLLGERIINIDRIDEIRILVECSNEIAFEFSSSNDIEDESFHVFCPDGMVWDFVPFTGWGYNKQ